MSVILKILVAIVVFGVMIFVHELGHFLTAKASGILVNEFAMGMGPKLISFVRKETRYSLRLFPIGGFCAMEGEDEDSPNERAFCNAKLWKRAVVMVAGSFMNLLLGFLILIFLTTQMNLIATTTVSRFDEGAATNQWLQVGDTITKINNHRVRTANDLSYELSRDRDGVMDIEVIRGEEILLLNGVTFLTQSAEGVDFVVLDFGVYGKEKTLGNVLTNSANWTVSLAKQVWGSLIDLFQKRYTVQQLSGPVGVTTAIGEAASRGLEEFFYFVSFITVNLGVFNMLPFPALDGGRLVFLIIEAIRRKPVPVKYESAVNLVGFALLIGLMIFVTFNDVRKLFGFGG